MFWSFRSGQDDGTTRRITIRMPVEFDFLALGDLGQERAGPALYGGVRGPAR